MKTKQPQNPRTVRNEAAAETVGLQDLVSEGRTPRWAFAVVALGLAVFGIYSASHMVAAGDTWVALACGRHFVNHGVDTVEPFSFNSHTAGPTEEDIARWPGWARALAKPFPLSFIQKVHPTGWINQNWLTHVIFYKLVDTGTPGVYRYNMLVYWKFALYILTAVVVYFVGRTIGVGPLLSLAGAAFAMVIGRSFFDIRPAAWSNLLAPAFVLVLALTTYRNYRYVWLVVPLVVFWANVHGGYLYAFIMLIPFIGLHIAAHLPKKWTFALGSVATWTVLYLIVYQFRNHEYFATLYKAIHASPYVGLSLTQDKFFYFLLVLIGGSLVLTRLGEKKPAAFYAYHGVTTLIVFMGLLMRLMVVVPQGLSEPFNRMLNYLVTSTQIKFFAVQLLAGVFIYLLTWRKDRLVKLPAAGIKHAILAFAAAFVAMIVFNPFHLTNLTHTFEISVSEHAASWRRVNEWRPAFDSMDPTTDRPNPVGNEEAFGVFIILTAVVMGAWFLLRFLKPRPAVAGRRSAEPAETGFSQFPIDLPLLTIVFLTVYMAIQSRRFIAIAGPAAAPFTALLLQQTVAMFLRMLQRKTPGAKLSGALVRETPAVAWSAAALILAVLTIIWGMKFYRIYLGPWPLDSQRNSIFMRMTASNVKPYEVCDFINLNRLEGRMFNYWTEGGAVAFGENPDPEMGKIPVQLFMDGRAQAAYNHDKYELWQYIFAGGRLARELQEKDGDLSSSDYVKIGQWINSQLKQHNVWVILMPTNDRNTRSFLKYIAYMPNWKTVFYDSNQQLLVDTDTSRGKELVEEVLDGKAAYPDEFSRHLSTAKLIIESRSADRLSELRDHVIKAFEIRPDTASTLIMLNAASLTPIQGAICERLEKFLDDFTTRQDAIRKESGYIEKATAAAMAGDYLAKIRPEKRSQYTQLSKQLQSESARLNNQFVW